MKLQLIKNTNFNKENFFNKKELQEILNLYGSMVSAGEWKDYGIFMGKNIISFEIYRKATDTREGFKPSLRRSYLTLGANYLQIVPLRHRRSFELHKGLCLLEPK